jgi:hypothetical protein
MPAKGKHFILSAKQKHPIFRRIPGVSLAEDEGFDSINVRLGLALAGGAHPRRI